MKISIKKKATFYALLLLVFFPILPFKIISILLVSYAVLNIVFFWNEGIQKLKMKRYYIPLLVNIGFYFFLLLSLSYSSNIKTGLVELQKALPLLLLPIVVFVFQPNFSKKEFRIIISGFILANFFFIMRLAYYIHANAILECYYLISEFDFNYKMKELLNHSFKENLWCAEQQIRSKFFIHKAYNSINLLIALLGSIYLLSLQKIRVLEKIILVIMMLFFIAVIFYMLSLTNIFIACFLPLFLMLYFMKHKKKWLLGSFICVYAIMTLVVLFKHDDIGFIKQKKELIMNHTDSVKTESRKDIMECNLELVSNNGVLGMGIGDVQDGLDSVYKNRILDAEIFQNLIDEKHDSHNYFMFLILAGGLGAVFSFCLMLFYNIKQALRTNEYIYVFFLCLFIINLFFENILTRMIGLVSFSLFNALFFKQFILTRDED